MEEFTSLFTEAAFGALEAKLTYRKESISLQSFLLLAVLGKGSYAKVLLVRKKDTGDTFAIKVLKKEQIMKRNQHKHVCAERNILASLDHPFIVKMFWAFQNEKKLFFTLEFCPGGELFNLLQKRRFFTETQARFYIAQIILALAYLHDNGIIYRDLKPENVLIDKDGYVKLTDFGLSKTGMKENHRAYSLCGTPEYLAPEILFKMGYSCPVDWWTLGALAYEMMTGIPPFCSARREDTFELIKFGNVRFPKEFSPEARDFIGCLLKKDPSRRLGSGSTGVDEIKQHPWLSSVNWDGLLRKEIIPPFVPVLSSEIDISNFDPEFTRMEVDSFHDQFALADEFALPAFEGFSYEAEVPTVLSTTSPANEETNTSSDLIMKSDLDSSGNFTPKMDLE